MKYKNVLLLAAAIGLMLTACGDAKETASPATDSTVKSTTQAEAQKTEETKEAEVSTQAEELPDSQEYVSTDGSYKITLIEGITQTDMQLSDGFIMMGLDGGSERTGFSGIALRCDKSSVPKNSGAIESLEDFADYITDLTLDGSGVTVTWEDTDAPSTEGAQLCIAKEGVARSGISRGQAYGYHVETADNYYSVVIVGNDDDVEEARQVLAIEILDGASSQAAEGTIGFINGMTAVLDSVNGANTLETSKTMLDAADGDKELIDTLSSQLQQNLSNSWGIESAADLIETADWLISEGHNQDALDFLSECGGMDETDHDAFDAKLKEQNLDDGTYISLLAAYDAHAAYGDGAIAAWDLSRVGTIMGMGYGAGYCTYEEAMDKILEAAVKSQELFDSWEDFNKSYLYGYSYWAEESLDDSGSSAAERAEIVNELEAKENGPFAVEWSTELKKEW